MREPYRWVIVAVGALMSCVALGAMFSLAVFLELISTATGWSRAGISSGMTLNFIVMGLGAFGWGAASDRFGTPIVVLFGAALLGLALVLASQATSLIQFQLTYGILVGLAAKLLAQRGREGEGHRNRAEHRGDVLSGSVPRAHVNGHRL